MENEQNTGLSARLRELRLNHGFTYEKLAKETGLSEATLKNYESTIPQKVQSADKMRIITLIKLANFYNIEPSYLLSGAEENLLNNDDEDEIFWRQINAQLGKNITLSDKKAMKLLREAITARCLIPFASKVFDHLIENLKEERLSEYSMFGLYAKSNYSEKFYERHFFNAVAMFIEQLMNDNDVKNQLFEFWRDIEPEKAAKFDTQLAKRKKRYNR